MSFIRYPTIAVEHVSRVCGWGKMARFQSPRPLSAADGNSMIEVTEVSIAQLRAALESGQTTAVELVQAYLARIDAYDGANTPTALNAVVVRNPEALNEARASDARRARGETLGPLDGIPWMAFLTRPRTATWSRA